MVLSLGQSSCTGSASTCRQLTENLLQEMMLPPCGPCTPRRSFFASAWRNYLKSVFQKGCMYRVSCKPSLVIYVAENKTLAGKEDRAYEGEAMGRKRP